LVRNVVGRGGWAWGKEMGIGMIPFGVGTEGRKRDAEGEGIGGEAKRDGSAMPGVVLVK